MAFDEAATRAEICAVAISWEMTPYHPHARIKGLGVDCAQFPIAVYSEFGALPTDYAPTYSQEWMTHRDEELYLDEIRRFAREIPESEIKPGDLIVWKFGRTFSHSAILLDSPIVIHAIIKGGFVLRSDMDQDSDLELPQRERRCFSIFEADGSGLIPGWRS